MHLTTGHSSFRKPLHNLVHLSISIKEFPIQDLNLWLPIDSRVFLTTNTNQELIYTSDTAEVPVVGVLLRQKLF